LLIQSYIKLYINKNYFNVLSRVIFASTVALCFVALFLGHADFNSLFLGHNHKIFLEKHGSIDKKLIQQTQKVAAIL